MKNQFNSKLPTLNSKLILVTGAAGFIGFHLCKRLLDRGEKVIGLDNLNNYYDVNLKIARLKNIEAKENFRFVKIDLAGRESVAQLFAEENFDIVVNLAAQAGVRYSLSNPYTYINTNITGFLNILEGCRLSKVKHLVFASSSSVYGANTKIPFSVQHSVDHPVSMYAVTKKTNELMAHAYSSLHNLPCTGLRFFTVYGPWGRPDMVLFLFTKAILEDRSIDVYNYGKMKRDFTYIDDIVEGVIKVIDKIPESNTSWTGKNPDVSSSYAPYKLYNIGNNNPVDLMKFIEILEDCLGIKAKKNLMPIQLGDVPVTCANIDDFIEDIGFKPSTPIENGIEKFVKWYKDYYK